MVSKTKSDFLGFNLIRFLSIFQEQTYLKDFKRTDLMFQENCIAEVKKFNKLSLNKNLSANKLIGVQEINKFLKGSINLMSVKNSSILRQDSTLNDKIHGLEDI